MDRKINLAKATLINIPRTGRIGRFIKILEGQVDEISLLTLLKVHKITTHLSQIRKRNGGKALLKGWKLPLGKKNPFS